MKFRVALDQNFPTNLVSSIEGAVPQTIELRSVWAIDPKLSDMGDRQLILSLHSIGFDALVSQDARILQTPEHLAALLATKIGFVCVRNAANSSIKATGALLLELSRLPRVFQERGRRVLDLHFESRRPRDAWHYMEKIAKRSGTEARKLYAQFKPTAEELRLAGS
ncbi:MAG: hypothetical protein LBK95_12550 [Bifidobacteriaceae bacterium]|jgi:hypothetical protein|nr:hypothetical protein [Bifidobacteriaceae bacterium]